MKLQITQAIIRKNCRDVHGDNGAFDKAVELLKEKYKDVLTGGYKNNTITMKLMIQTEEGVD